jgi:hypothetical protein
MRKFNTSVSYAFRSLAILTLAGLGLLSKMRPGNPSSDATHFLVLNFMIGLTCVFLVLDWATQKDLSRRFFQAGRYGIRNRVVTRHWGNVYLFAEHGDALETPEARRLAYRRNVPLLSASLCN